MTQETKWIRVSEIEEMAEEGACKGFRLDGLDIAVFRWDQQYYALENFCPHLGFPLTEGIVQDGTVICGWHGWRVRLDDGGCPGKTLTARSYPCEVRGDSIWVQVPESA